MLDGTPRDALRTLRADFEEARQEEIERALGASGTASVAPRAQISGATLRAESGRLGRPTLNGSEGLYVNFDITATAPITDYVIGVGIATSMGTGVFSTSTKLLGVAAPPLRAKNRYEVFLPELRLGEGEYAISLNIVSADGTELHRIPEAGQFLVSGEIGRASCRERVF